MIDYMTFFKQLRLNYVVKLYINTENETYLCGAHSCNECIFEQRDDCSFTDKELAIIKEKYPEEFM